MAAIRDDYLAVGPLIVERLDALLDGVQVKGIEHIAQATETNLLRTTAFVLWERDLFDESEGGRASRGSSQIASQVWTVLLAVRHASQVDETARNTVAGPLLSLIHQALSGWQPDATHRPFRRTNGRQASYGKNVGLYPLSFAITLNL